MKLDGFDSLWYNNKIIDPESIFYLSLSNDSFQRQYNIFKERIFNSIGKTFLPVYRMSDGEFNFCLRKTSIKKKLLNNFKISNNYSSTCWGEKYSIEEIRRVWHNYVDALKEISRQGYLALHFIDGNYFGKYAGYIEQMCDWFDQNGIELAAGNYIPFYFVYALLSGRDSVELFRNQRILIITSNHNNKFNKLERELLSNYNVHDISFFEISGNKSLLDKINLKQISTKVDLVLVGAGIGSSSIMVQLSSLNTVCIDSGIFLEMLIDKSLNTTRLFLKEVR